MRTTRDQVDQVDGIEKFQVLASAIDTLGFLFSALQQNLSLDEQTRTLDAKELASNYGVSFETFRSQVRETLGTDAIFRLGKKWVIRHLTFRDFLQAKEAEDEKV